MQFKYPADLPIVHYRDAFIELLQEHQVIIVSGETGSGKTTQLPKFCLEFCNKKTGHIGCTQPRRVAATSVSSRVASELGPHSSMVGYKIRFHDRTTKNTRIKFMTDGVLLAETKQDPLLKKYDLIIIDEAHERSLNIDFLLGYLKKLLPRRPDLKVIITSATIDTEIFSGHFHNAPIMTVEGRSYEVEVRYQPADDEEKDQFTYVEQSVQALRQLYQKEHPEDTLIFLPTEKDIRECCNLLEKSFPDHLVLPMFGRLASGDQKKIFISSARNRIVVATNVAETSITVPGIRYVIDSGLARISQYNVRARTTSLPITRISRASADQRKGRCGRTGTGICIRLFSEEDYQNRPAFTLPEIKRSNLADVILQMISMNLGSPLEFPFVEPPSTGAIRDGYSLLNELGALTNDKLLNETGALMARLPIDPPISRILIAARENNCVREIKIIAPALAIQDPRIRPANKESAADEAHKVFAHKHSDFLSLLKIWDLYHNVKQSGLSWNRLKKFCKGNYLSFQRMREWIDLHDQLARIIDREKGFAENCREASYEAIHKSLCCGFLRNIGKKKENDKKLYMGAGAKEFMVFPGSHQFHSSGKWLIGAAFLETNRLYGLTVANIEVEWLIAASNHLSRKSWSNPRWNQKSGQVVADEKITLFGLILSADRQVNFGRTTSHNQDHARQIFIQDAILIKNLTGKYPFLEHNCNLIKKWQDTEERLRKRDLLVDDTTLYHFYDARLPDHVYDRFTLNRFLSRKDSQDFLMMNEEDILNRRPQERELQDFPKKFNIGSRSLRLTYHLAPGRNDDGVTVRIPIDDMNNLPESTFEWLVPGLIREKVSFLLKGLPKRLRKHLIPINNTVDLLLDDSIHYKGSLYHALEQGIFKAFRIKVNRSDWPEPLPQHLLMRFLVYDTNGRQIGAGRNLSQLSRGDTVASKAVIRPDSKITRLIEPWKDRFFTTWDFSDLPRHIPLFSSNGDIAGYLYPYLRLEKNRGGVTLCFDTDKEKAARHNISGVLYLYQLQFKEQFKSLKKYCHTTLSGPSSDWFIMESGNRTKATDALLNFILRQIFTRQLETIPEKDIFDAEIHNVSKLGLYRKGQEICDELLTILRQRKEVSEHILKFATLAKQSHFYDNKRYNEYQQLLEEILPADFTINTRLSSDISDCIRYCKALMIRIERAHANPAKDLKKAEQLQPYIDKLKVASQKESYSLPAECREALDHYQTMINDYRVTIFAPELKGGNKVSAKKLKLLWQGVQSLCPGI